MRWVRDIAARFRHSSASLRDRMHSQTGETLIETLVAILVCVFATVILLTSTLSASNINRKANDRSAELAGQQTDAEGKTATSGEAKTGQTVTIGSTSVTVTYYGGEDLTAYYDGSE